MLAIINFKKKIFSIFDIVGLKYECPHRNYIIPIHTCTKYAGLPEQILPLGRAGPPPEWFEGGANFICASYTIP